MAYRKTAFVENEFYHIYSRGNSKQKIFLDIHDYERFVKLLYLCNGEVGVDFREDIIRKNISAWDFDCGRPIVFLGAWVLMPNHFHIYLTINSRKSDFRNFRKNGVTEFMRKLLTSYSKYFNTKHSRTGGLFEGKFKSVHLEGDTQAKYLFSYIHLNPLRLIDKNWKENKTKDFKKNKNFLDNYKWSSYLDHKGIARPENKILYIKAFPDYFQNIKDFDQEIEEWLNFNLNSAEVCGSLRKSDFRKLETQMFPLMRPKAKE
ncbi:hypothetical protein HYZ82_02445 [Candidatus Nomurabacteria bacterium]|nr:hypothetical protein [Candidatus Nomurabacteria bacterium]